MFGLEQEVCVCVCVNKHTHMFSGVAEDARGLVWRCEWRGGARLYSQVIVGEPGLETC